jgi:uncharacterized protein (TIGR02996 family)
MLADNPDDKDRWQVYADWLLEQGERWGEVIVAACAGKTTKEREDELAAQWIDGLDGITVTWRHGVVYEVTIAPDNERRMGDASQRMFAHPAGRWLRSLTVVLPPHGVSWGCGDAIQSIVEGGPLPLLERLDMSPSKRGEWQFNRYVGDLSGLWMAVPRLKDLRLRGTRSDACQLGRIEAPHLETLVFISSGLGYTVPEEIGQAMLPSLLHLEIYLGRQDFGNYCTIDSFAPILDGKGLPKLETLALR